MGAQILGLAGIQALGRAGSLYARTTGAGAWADGKAGGYRTPGCRVQDAQANLKFAQRARDWNACTLLQAALHAELLQFRTAAPVAKDAEQRAAEAEQALTEVCNVCVRVCVRVRAHARARARAR
eukprot:53394-Pelagomonas_calceolata.AAC.1